jgi:hypothetical protein
MGSFWMIINILGDPVPIIPIPEEAILLAR